MDVAALGIGCKLFPAQAALFLAHDGPVGQQEHSARIEPGIIGQLHPVARQQIKERANEAVPIHGRSELLVGLLEGMEQDILLAPGQILRQRFGQEVNRCGPPGGFEARAEFLCDLVNYQIPVCIVRIHFR